VQLGGDAGAVGIRFGGGQALAELQYFFFARAAPAYLRPAAGCGHVELLKRILWPTALYRISPAGDTKL
jgi:hypothetical protein